MLDLAVFSGSEIFIDSNIFIFNATGTGPYEECENLLLKIKYGEMIGYTNPIVIEEVHHKLLILEVCTKYEKKPFEAVRFIKENPYILAEIDKPGNVNGGQKFPIFGGIKFPS